MIVIAILLTFNLLFGFFSQMEKKKISKHYYYSVLGATIAGMMILTL